MLETEKDTSQTEWYKQIALKALSYHSNFTPEPGTLLRSLVRFHLKNQGLNLVLG